MSARPPLRAVSEVETALGELVASLGPDAPQRPLALTALWLAREAAGAEDPRLTVRYLGQLARACDGLARHGHRRAAAPAADWLTEMRAAHGHRGS